MAKRKPKFVPLTAEQYAALLAFDDRVSAAYLAGRIPQDVADAYVAGVTH